MSNLDNILSKVRGLVAKAEHPDTPDTEARACREKADAMMLQYAIDQAMLRQSQPAAQRMKPGKIKVDVVPAGSPFEQMFLDLVAVVCDHTRCQPLFYGAGMDAAKLEAYGQYFKDPVIVTATVYGFEGDLKYFEILYTTLLLHMSNGIDPQVDGSLSDQENAYNLHMAGLNWLEIASLYYRRGHEHGWNGDKSDYMRYGGYWKRAYRREATKRDESIVTHPAKFTDAARLNWRQNFAKSYVITLAKRLWMARNERSTGSELVLSADMDAIRKMLEDEHPNVETLDRRDAVKYNSRAWSAGSSHANSADLDGSSKIARPDVKQIY